MDCRILPKTGVWQYLLWNRSYTSFNLNILNPLKAGSPFHYVSFIVRQGTKRPHFWHAQSLAFRQLELFDPFRHTSATKDSVIFYINFSGNFDINKPYKQGQSCGDCGKTCNDKLCGKLELSFLLIIFNVWVVFLSNYFNVKVIFRSN